MRKPNSTYVECVSCVNKKKELEVITNFVKKYLEEVSLDTNKTIFTDDKTPIEKLIGYKSFLKDFPCDFRGKIGITYWKLKQTHDDIHPDQ